MSLRTELDRAESLEQDRWEKKIKAEMLCYKCLENEVDVVGTLCATCKEEEV